MYSLERAVADDTRNAADALAYKSAVGFDGTFGTWAAYESRRSKPSKCGDRKSKSRSEAHCEWEKVQLYVQGLLVYLKLVFLLRCCSSFIRFLCRKLHSESTSVVPRRPSHRGTPT